MTIFYPSGQLADFTMEDFKRDIMGKTFVCKLKERTFIGVVRNIIASQPDNLPSIIVFKTEDGSRESVEVLSIELLTLKE